MPAKIPLKTIALSSDVSAIGTAYGTAANYGFSDDVVRIGVLNDIFGIYTDFYSEAAVDEADCDDAIPRVADTFRLAFEGGGRARQIGDMPCHLSLI